MDAHPGFAAGYEDVAGDEETLAHSRGSCEVSLSRDAVGRVYPLGPPYEVTLQKVREFAVAIGDDNPVYRDRVAAQAAGLPGVVAPPTFAYVVGSDARQALLGDPRLGLAYGRAVHGEQAFSYVRPILVGDVLSTRCSIVDVAVRGANEVLSWREELVDEAGQLVCTSDGSIVSRGTAARPA